MTLDEATYFITHALALSFIAAMLTTAVYGVWNHREGTADVVDVFVRFTIAGLLVQWYLS